MWIVKEGIEEEFARLAGERGRVAGASRGRVPTVAGRREPARFVGLSGTWRNREQIAATRASESFQQLMVARQRLVDSSELSTFELAPRSAERSQAELAAATSTSASVTSTIPSRSATAMCSSGVWISVIPFARLTQLQAACVEDVRVRSTAAQRVGRRVAGTLERLGREPDRRVALAEAVAREARPHLAISTSQSARLAANAAVSSISRTSSTALRSSCERTSAVNEHHSGTTLRAVPPEITPTFALVSSSIAAEAEVGDRARGGRDRRAAVLGVHPRVRGRAVEAEVENAGVRRAEDDLADRRALVVDVARRRDEPRVVERVGAAERHLLLRREDELDPGVRLDPRRGSAAPLRASRRPRPCCRSRGSCRPRCARCRPPRRPARSPSRAEPCPCARRGRSASRRPFVGGIRQ